MRETMGGISCENCRGFTLTIDSSSPLSLLVVWGDSKKSTWTAHKIACEKRIQLRWKCQPSFFGMITRKMLRSLWLCLLFFAFYFMLLNKILIVFLPFILVLQTVIQVFNLSTFHTLLEWKTEENEKKKESKRERQKKRRETRDTKEILEDKKNFAWNENLTNDSGRNEFFFRCFSWKKRRVVTTEFSSFQVSWNERAMIPLLSSSLLIVQLMFICHSFLFRTQRQKGRRKREGKQGVCGSGSLWETGGTRVISCHPFSLPDHHHQHHQ